MSGASSSSRSSAARARRAPEGVSHGRILREGDIRPDTMPILFHHLSEARATGFLRVTEGETQKVVQFGEGHVLFASSNQRDDRFSQFLIKSNVVSLKNLMRALEVMIATKDRLGEILVRFKM